MTTIAEASPAVQAYTSLLLHLHDLMLVGKGNSPEADEVRDRMEKPWFALTEQERERVRGLSVDLYAIADGGAKSTDMTEADRVRWSSEVKSAVQPALQMDGDPNLALAALRRPFPSGVRASTVPFLQSRIWESLDDVEVALRFMREAERLDSTLAICVLILLEKLGNYEEAEQYANRILFCGASTTDERYLAAPANAANDKG